MNSLPQFPVINFTSFLLPKQNTRCPCFWPATVLLVISRNKHLSHGLVQSNKIKICQCDSVKLNLSWKHSYCISYNIASGPTMYVINDPWFEREIR